MIEMLEEYVDKHQLQDRIVEKWHSMIMSDDFRYFKEYLERRDGKVKEVVEVNENRPEIHLTVANKHADRIGTPNGSANGFSEQ